MTRVLVHGNAEWRIKWDGDMMLAHTVRNGWNVSARSEELAPEAVALILVGVGIANASVLPGEDGVHGLMADNFYDDFMALAAKYGWEVDVLDDVTAGGGENDNADEKLDPGARAQGSSCREAEARRADIDDSKGVAPDGGDIAEIFDELFAKARETRAQRGSSKAHLGGAEEALGRAQEDPSSSSKEAGSKVEDEGPERSGPIVVSEWR